MRLTAQITTPRQDMLDHFRYAGPDILDEEDYAPLREIESVLVEQGVAPAPWDEFIEQQIARVAGERSVAQLRHQ